MFGFLLALSEIFCVSMHGGQVGGALGSSSPPGEAPSRLSNAHQAAATRLVQLRIKSLLSIRIMESEIEQFYI